MIVLADTPERRAASSRRSCRPTGRRAPDEAKPFAAIHSLWDMVPEDQDVKLPILLEIGERLERARARGFVNDADWARIKDAIPPKDLRPTGSTTSPSPSPARSPRRTGRAGRSSSSSRSHSGSNDLRYSDPLLRLVPGDAARLGQDRARLWARRDLLPTSSRPSCATSRRPSSLSLALTILAVIDHVPRAGAARAQRPLRAPRGRRRARRSFLYVADVKLNFMNFVGAPDHLRHRGRLRGQRRAALPGRRQPRHPRDAPDDGRGGRPLQPHDDARIPRSPRVAQPGHPEPRDHRGGRRGELSARRGDGAAGALAPHRAKTTSRRDAGRPGA